MLQTQTCKTAMYTHNAYMPNACVHILVQLTATLNGVCNSLLQLWSLHGHMSAYSLHQFWPLEHQSVATLQ